MDLNPIRKLYAEAAKSQAKADELAQLVAQADAQNPTIMAYKGIVEAYKAKYALNPFSQLGYIQEANKQFKKAAEAEPNNIEIRFLRFTIQANTPAMLGLNKEIAEDKKVIWQYFTQTNIGIPMQKAIAEYLSKSDKCTTEEREQWHTVLQKLNAQE